MNKHLIDIDEYVWITFYTIDRIKAEWWKSASDALMLYFEYTRKVRIDRTNQPRATNEYMMDEKCLWRWKERFLKAKRVLQWLWLIEQIADRDEKWKVKKWYIKVNYIIPENKVKASSNLQRSENQTVANPEGGKQTTNALSTKTNALSTKLNDISKDISASATGEQTNTQCSKLVQTQQITSTQIRSEYKCPTNRKWNIKDVEKIMNWLSLEEQICALREVRLLTFELRLGIIEKMRCTTCAHAIENRTDDETMIIERVENIVNKLKNHKCKKAETKKEWEDEIKKFFWEYLEYAQQPEPTSKEERIKEYEKFASNWQQSKFKEVYPKADVKKIYEDWIMRCVSWRK